MRGWVDCARVMSKETMAYAKAPKRPPPPANPDETDQPEVPRHRGSLTFLATSLREQGCIFGNILANLGSISPCVGHGTYSPVKRKEQRVV
jgi:hypothetical protein